MAAPGTVGVWLFDRVRGDALHLQAMMARGLTFIDTAEVYGFGKSEVRIALHRAAARHTRQPGGRLHGDDGGKGLKNGLAPSLLITIA